jgi:hypothetical protein
MRRTDRLKDEAITQTKLNASSAGLGQRAYAGKLWRTATA